MTLHKMKLLGRASMYVCMYVCIYLCIYVCMRSVSISTSCKSQFDSKLYPTWGYSQPKVGPIQSPKWVSVIYLEPYPDPKSM